MILDNAMYGTIRMHQEREYPGRISATQLKNPDFKAYAQPLAATASAWSARRTLPGPGPRPRQRPAQRAALPDRPRGDHAHGHVAGHSQRSAGQKVNVAPAQAVPRYRLIGRRLVSAAFAGCSLVLMRLPQSRSCWRCQNPAQRAAFLCPNGGMTTHNTGCGRYRD